MALIVAASTPAGAFVLYHSPSGGPNPGTPASIPTGGSTTLHLYFDNGSTASPANVCVSGTGNEVCGFDLNLAATGSVTFNANGFTPAPGVVYSLSPTLLRANGGDPIAGDLGPTFVGDLAVSAAAAGSVQLSGRNFADAAVGLQTVAPAPIAVSGAGPGDLDGDAVLNAADNCPTVANGPAQASDPQLGNQLDGDADGVGDACDNCVGRANAPLSPLAFQTTSGGQLDDDADGYGNPCDADFNEQGATVDSGDFALFKLAFGHGRNSTECGPGGAAPCDVYDLTGSGGPIDSGDFGSFKALFGLKRGPRCPQCGPPYPDPNLPCVGDACP